MKPTLKVIKDREFLKGYEKGREELIMKIRCFLSGYGRTNIISIDTIREYLEELEK